MRRALFMGMCGVLLLAACGRETNEHAASDTPAADASIPAVEVTAAPVAPGVRALSGEELFEACAGCHTLGEGEPNMNGPNLFGLDGRAAGTHPGFTYSDALKASGITWNTGTLTGWIMATDAAVSGTWMVYHNRLSADEVQRLVAFVLGG